MLARPSGRRIALTAAALAAGVLILIGTVWLFSPQRLVDAVRTADLRWIAAGLMANALFLGLRGWRWRLLLSPVATLSTVRATAVTALGWGVNSVVPFKAGDLLRAYAIGMGRRPGFIEAAASVVVERVLDILALGLLVLLALPVAGPARSAQSRVLWSTVAFAAAAGLVATMIVAVRRPAATLALARRCLSPLPRGLASPLGRLAESALAGMGALRDLGLLAAALAQSLAIWLVQVLSIVCFYRAVAPPAAMATALLASALFTISQSVSVTPGSVGTYEGLFIAIFSIFALAEGSRLLAAAVLSHAVSAVFFVALAGGGLAYLGASPRQLWDASLGASRANSPSGP